MDNEHTIEYEGYSIHIIRDKKKYWHVTAKKEGERDIALCGRDREQIVDAVQYEIDLIVAAKDDSIQVSKAGVWNWLSNGT